MIGGLVPRSNNTTAPASEVLGSQVHMTYAFRAIAEHELTVREHVAAPGGRSCIRTVSKWHEAMRGPAQNRILIAHRLELLRTGLLFALHEARPDWSIEQTADLSTSLGVASNFEPTLALVDLNLPGMTTSYGIGSLRSALPECAVVILAETDERAVVLECLEAGAQGFISVTATPFQLLQALETVLAGGVFAPASLIRPAHTAAAATGSVPRMRLASNRPSPNGPTDNFTDRQQDVFRLLSEGCSTKTIARRLNLAVGTVKVHLAAIYRELGVHSRLEAVSRASTFSQHA